MLTLTHLNKEDEGLYTLRITTKTKYETYSAYVFVRGGGHTMSKTTHHCSLPHYHASVYYMPCLTDFIFHSVCVFECRQYGHLFTPSLFPLACLMFYM